MELGLIRNAAGKAFQAWKALLGALAVDTRDELAKVFNRDVELENRVIKEVDYVIALIPTTRMREIARIIETRHPPARTQTRYWRWNSIGISTTDQTQRKHHPYTETMRTH